MHPTHKTTKLAAFSLAAVTLVSATGCLVTSSSSSRYSGERVTPGADRAIVLGESTPDQAIAALGDPSSRVGEPGDETLTWRWTERTKSSGSVFLVFGGSSDSTHERALHIAFEDGVATRRWRD
ncbi:MAG: hypothetical protein AAGA55_04645 [Planctomycetota bacterium]